MKTITPSEHYSQAAVNEQDCDSLGETSTTVLIAAAKKPKKSIKTTSKKVKAGKTTKLKQKDKEKALMKDLESACDSLAGS